MRQWNLCTISILVLFKQATITMNITDFIGSSIKIYDYKKIILILTRLPNKTFLDDLSTHPNIIYVSSINIDTKVNHAFKAV